eukprot:GEMP01020854.1.p1 GENE.GEMP01020854.1~~GEMP01020854.1.p1  ORF type:complete len:665 (+),score=122.07 GEMP01020854.1:14-2008(+)
MKFGNQFERCRDVQFARFYLDYRTLKNSLKIQTVEEWTLQLEEQMAVAEQFYEEQIERAQARFKELRAVCTHNHSDFMHVHAQNQIAVIIKILRRLIDFVTLNGLALKKIVKKAKKNYNDPALPEEVLGLRILGPFHDKRLIVHEEMMREMLHCLEPSAVGINEILLMPSKREARLTRNVWFLSGINVTLLCFILFLIFVLPWSQDYQMRDLLALLKPFRFVSMLIFFLVGAGMALEMFERHGVNWRFLMDIEPTCLVTAQDVHRVASLLCCIVLLLFLVFITDVKFVGFTSRERRVQVYPTLLTLFVVAILTGPSDAIRRRYRRALLRIVLLCIIAPFGGNVRFCDNIMGDVLTSLAKPLQDLVWTSCYLASYAIYGAPALDYTTDVCGPNTTQILATIAMLPYWFRLMQCFSRYRETKVMAHWWNCGKYITGLVMVIITTIDWMNFGLTIYSARLIVVFAYCCATIYMYLWDIRMDWGLVDVESGNIIARHTMYPRPYYYVIGAFNTFGRMTWALTLIPIALNDHEVMEAIFFAVSAIEIARRSLWSVLRIERHHIQNIEEGNIVTTLGNIARVEGEAPGSPDVSSRSLSAPRSIQPFRARAANATLASRPSSISRSRAQHDEVGPSSPKVPLLSDNRVAEVSLSKGPAERPKFPAIIPSEE